MDFRYLGLSGLKVSSFCLGTMTYGETTEEKDAHLQISEAFSYGINFIDTAEMYPTCPIRKETSGETEKIIGNWINNNKVKRKDIILATKVVGNGLNYADPFNPFIEPIDKWEKIKDFKIPEWMKNKKYVDEKISRVWIWFFNIIARNT